MSGLSGQVNSSTAAGLKTREWRRYAAKSDDPQSPSDHVPEKDDDYECHGERRVGSEEIEPNRRGKRSSRREGGHGPRAPTSAQTRCRCVTKPFAETN